jgi:hypothetical protein
MRSSRDAARGEISFPGEMRRSSSSLLTPLELLSSLKVLPSVILKEEYGRFISFDLILLTS